MKSILFNIIIPIGKFIETIVKEVDSILDMDPTKTETLGLEEGSKTNELTFN